MLNINDSRVGISLMIPSVRENLQHFKTNFAATTILWVLLLVFIQIKIFPINIRTISALVTL